MTSYQMSKSVRTSSSSLLKDDSWIRKDEDEYEAVDRDPNFASSVLNHYKSTESLTSPVSENKQITRSTSVQALTTRFGGSQDELPDSSYTKSRVSHTLSSPTYRRSDEPEMSSTTTTLSRDGKITETTTITSSQSLRSPNKTFSERVQSFSKTAEDQLYDSLLPNAIKDDDRTSLSTSSETMTVRRSINGAEDELYDTLVPRSITSAQSSSFSSSSVSKREIVTVESSVSPLSSSSSLRSTSRSYTDEIPSARVTSYTISSGLPNDNYSSKSGSYYYSSSSSSKPSYEYSSPTEYSSTTYRTSSRSDDILSGPVTSVKSVYNTSDRSVLERELCTYCHKPFNGDPKMILDDMKISCHSFCFKCEVCNGSLGHLKAGDCMWVYNSMVHCENCFDVTREKWRR